MRMADVSVILFGTFVSLSTLKHVLSRLLSLRKPKNVSTPGCISGIYIYPVKSCAGIEVESARVTHSGLMELQSRVLDRQFMVVDAESKNFISQRKEPTMALVKPRIDGKFLFLEAPGMKPLSVPLQPEITSSQDIFLCRVWGDPIPGLHCGPEAQDWFTTLLKRPAALMYNATSLDKRLLHDSHLCRDYDNVTYVDWGQVLCISDASLVDLNRRLEQPVEMRNFRPNFTVLGCPPNDEDNWHKLYIRDVQFTNIKLCGRCVMTTVDPKEGTKSSDGQPLKTLKSYRKKPGFGEDPCFGINVFCDVEGVIGRGDPIDVVRNDENIAWF